MASSETMADYLGWHEGWTVEVRLKPDNPDYPWVIGGTLERAGDGYIAVKHDDGTQYVVMLTSIKMVKIEQPASGE